MKTVKSEIKKLADKMDLKAEDINARDFVIAHRALAVLSVRTIGAGPTLKLLEALHEEGGLPGLNGGFGSEPKDGTLLSRLGIPEDWDDWDLP